MENKECNICKVQLQLSKYRKYTDRDNSYSKTCKSCLNEQDKRYKFLKRQKRLEELILKCEKCNEDRKLKDFTKLKRFYKKKICSSCYPEFLKEQKTKWCKDERQKNVNYRLKKSLAARLRSVLKKENCTMNYIGCNIQYLKMWFEYNFTQDMSWDNYGSYWSIDHIIPVSKFDLTNEDEKMKCWNWSNLVPNISCSSSKRSDIDLNQVDNIKKKLEKFKEEGSTTKWFSNELILNMERVSLS